MLLIMTMIWGATFLFTKQSLDYCSPFEFILLRFLLALSLCVIFFGKHILTMDWLVIKQGTILGLFFIGGFILQTTAMKFTSISKTAFITGLTVVVTPFVYYILRRKSVSFWSWMGVLVAFIGLYLFTNPQFDNLNIGDILTFISCGFWAFYITLMDSFTKNRHTFAETIQLVTVQFLVSVPIALIGHFVFYGPAITIVLNPKLIYGVAFNGIMASFILLLVHTTYQKHTTPVKAALIFSLEPIFAAIVAYIFAKEVLGLREQIGAFIMMFGVMVSEFGLYVATTIRNKIYVSK